MTQYGFHFDGTRCTGCKTCVLACKDKNDLPNDINFRNVVEYGGGSWKQDGAGCWTTDAFTDHVSVACNHCDEPVCLANCPQGAIGKDEATGEVFSDPEMCIGCGTCAASCPYGAPKVDDAKKKSVKCDMCADRVAAGKQPVCVEACPLRALDFGKIEDLRAKYGDTAEVAPLPAASQTKPNLVITLPANAKGASGDVENPREIM